MLYEKSATKADIQHLADWLETKTGSYDPKDPHRCMLQQYLKASNPEKYVGVGMKTASVGPDEFALPFEIKQIAYNNKGWFGLSNSEPFAKAHKRALEILKNWPE